MSEENKPKWHAAAGVLILLVGLSIALSSIPLFGRAVVQDVGPGMFPLVIGILLALLGLYEAIASFPRKIPLASSDKLTLLNFIRRHTTEMELVGLLVLYFGALYLLGFFISTLGFLFVASWLFGARRWREIVPFSVIVSVGLYWLFVKVLHLTLPEGLLGI